MCWLWISHCSRRSMGRSLESKLPLQLLQMYCLSWQLGRAKFLRQRRTTLLQSSCPISDRGGNVTSAKKRVGYLFIYFRCAQRLAWHSVNALFDTSFKFQFKSVNRVHDKTNLIHFLNKSVGWKSSSRWKSGFV